MTDILVLMNVRRRFIVLGAGVFLLLAVAGSVVLYARVRISGAATVMQAQYKTPEEAANVYVRFDMEAYDRITQNYWQKVKDADLAQLFLLSVQKAAGTSTLATTTRAGVATMLETSFASASSTDAKKQLAANILMVALYNLAPQGRDQLLSKQQVTSLRQEVSNVNPQKNLYSDLGLPKGADTQAVTQAYTQKKAALSASSSPEAKQALAQVTYAHEVLANRSDKARYDTSLVEPTVFARTIGKTLYLYLSSMAPTTVQEFAEAVDAASTTPGIDSMIIDMRGNIGGALDFADYFLGLFQGQNQYAFDLFHQGDYQVQRTASLKFSELDRYTANIALFTDNMTQSTAEVTTAAFKRLHLGHVVGATTRGWGSVEDTYPLATVIDPNTTYSLLLVNSLTLRDDNQPIEGNGVDPDVALSNKNWQQELGTYFTSASLIAAIKKTIVQPPSK